ncbi:TetR/AcrR family transcriptional regulator [Streptomyces mirabilis]|uniref:TetR/AcrR family transcriptional regulator n=1 Tax=Streptomyces mirabilis TaxID=68239 RepID=UPI00367C0655
MASTATPVRRRRGRGARERITAAAQKLFTTQGVNVTGIGQLAVVAAVSKRTLYLHFASKDDLVQDYLTSLDAALLPSVPDGDMSQKEARAGLLSVFDPIAANGRPYRGCPFINVAVEIADPEHPAQKLATAHKIEFQRRLTELARRAGAADPQLLASHLALLHDGAASLVLTTNNSDPQAAAHFIAAAAIDAAVSE